MTLALPEFEKINQAVTSYARDFQMPWIATLLFFIFVASLTIVSPNTAPFTFLACLLLSIIYLAREDLFPNRTEILRPIWMAGILLGIFCTINACLTMNFLDVPFRTIQITIATGSIFLIAHLFQHGRGQDIRVLSAAVVTTAVAGAAYLVFEFLTDFALQRFLVNQFPIMRPWSDKYVDFHDGQLVSIEPHTVNKSVACVALLFWPAALIISAASSALWKWLSLAILTTLTLAATLLSESETTKLAVLGGFAVFAFTVIRPHHTFWLLLASFLTAFIVIVPLSLISFKTGLHNADWIQSSGRHRLKMWDETAKRTLKAPFFGSGVRADRAALFEPKSYQGTRKNLSQIHPRLGYHPHNNYLQIWHEMGLFGVIFFAGFGCLLLRQISGQTQMFQRFAYPCFAATALCMATGWEIWEFAWFYSVVFLITTMLLANRFAILSNQQMTTDPFTTHGAASPQKQDSKSSQDDAIEGEIDHDVVPEPTGSK